MTATVQPTEFGGVYTCAVAPRLAPLNFVRVDVINGDLADVVAAARGAAKDYSLRTIVVDAWAGPMTNATFEGDDSRGEWYRRVRGIYVWEGERAKPKHATELLSLDEFIAARRAFLEASPDHDVAEAPDEEAAVRVFANAVTTQHWGARVEGELVSVGELYRVDDIAQLESLSTLPTWGRRGFGAAVTQARVNAAHAAAAVLVFAQIEADNEASIALHERVGFTHVGLRNAFVLS